MTGHGTSEPMLTQASEFAVLAAISPTALLVVAVYLGSAQPRRTAAYYLAGAILMSVITGVIVLVALRTGNLSRPGERAPRYGLRLGLGLLALAAGVFIVNRKPTPPDPGERRPLSPAVGVVYCHPVRQRRYGR